MSVHITDHAINRYQERISPVSREDARRVLEAAENAVEFAAAFGAHTVRLGNGAKLVLRGLGRIRVVTVLPRDWINAMDRPRPAALGAPGRDHVTVCCAACGIRRGHPIARACTRTNCSLARAFGADA